MDAARPADKQSHTESFVGKVVNDRFRIVRPLGRGGMGAVYLALDAASGNHPVALKRVRKDRADARALAILRNEFLALASLTHPNLARAYEFGIDRDSDDLFFTSEYVSGIHWLKATRPLDLADPRGFGAFVHFLVQVLRVLEFIHARGMVHGDIKPENVLVTTPRGAGADAAEGEADEAGMDAGGGGQGLDVKLIDFGLVKREKVRGGKKILGTPYYVAPETILGSQIDRRTDLYSLGVVLYHLVTGQQPFRGATNLEILQCHVERTPPPPRDLSPGIPLDLNDIIMRLIQKKPADRFQGALEVIDCINRSRGLSIPLETPATRVSYIEASRLVGREAEVSRLRGILLAASATVEADRDPDKDLDGPGAEQPQRDAALSAREAPPRGRMLVVRGERGLGKERLIQDLRHFAQTQGAVFVEVRCAVPADGDAVLAALVRRFTEAASPSEKPAPIRAVEAAAALFEGVQANPGGWTPELEHLLDAVTRQVFAASSRGPVVLHFSDFHLAAMPCIRLVESMVRALAEGKEQGGRLLITATALDRGGLEEGALEWFSGTALYRDNVLDITLQRLSEEDVGRLVRTAFQGCEIPDTFVHRVLEESDGNPDVIVEILKFFLDRSTITRHPMGWALKPGYENEDVPGKVRKELMERIARLPQEALDLATAFACLGDAADLDLATKLAEVPDRQVLRSLERLRAEKILQASGGAGRPNEYSFVHASARTMLYKRLPPVDLARAHQRAGALTEERAQESGKAPLKDLARHYLKAGNREKGVRYGLEAAKELSAELAPLRAIETYEQVLALAASEDTALASKIHRAIAALRFQIGDYRGVLSVLANDARRGSPSEKAPVYLEAARAHARLGQFQEAIGLLSRSLRLDGKKESMHDLAGVMLALAEIHHFKGNPVESLRCCARILHFQEDLKEADVLSPAYMLMAESSLLLGDVDGAVGHCQLALRIVDASHESANLAWGLYLRGKYYSLKRQYTKALPQFQLCLILRQKTSEFDGQADCLREIGTLHHLLGSQAEARKSLEQALELYKKTENLPMAVATLCTLAEVFRLIGEHEACQDAIAETLRRMEPLEKSRLTANTLHTMAGAALDCGELAKARHYLDEAERSRVRGASGGVKDVVALGILTDLCQHEGELGAALDFSQRAVLAARELKDPLLLAQATASEAHLHARLGKTGEARRLLVPLLETAKRHDLEVAEGWARLLEGMVLAEEAKLEQSEKAFARAAELLGSSGSERDLVRLYLEHGLLCLKRDDFEQAYLNFEEGFHLAEKLQLPYYRCWHLYAMGCLEAALPEGQAPRAEKSFRAAEAIALESPYPEIAWRIQYALGKLFLRNGRGVEAESRLREAHSGLSNILRGVPVVYADSYRIASGAEDLDEMLEKVEGLLAVQA